jgi:hypothetical protein
MLTSDLLRVKISKGRVLPRFLDAADPVALERAAGLTRIFADGLDSPRADIERAVDESVGYGTDFLIWRGLAKLLHDRSTFETVAPADPVDIRRAVFARAVELGPVTSDATRDVVLEAAAADLGVTAQQVSDALYADLEARQLLTAHDPIDPLALLHRYNLALAQAVLYRATRMEIELGSPRPARLRYLFQSLKFYRLMHRAWRTDDGITLSIDGPASLFSQSRKYGLQMATFLPALVTLREWRLCADIAWERGKDYTLELDADSGLVSHYSPKGQWISEEERVFERRFAERVDGWTIERRGMIHELERGEVLVSDYVLTHEDSGKEVFVEVVGFWRKSYLERRVAMLGALSDVPIVLVVSQRLRSDKGKLEDAGPRVVFFKGVILVNRVLDAAIEVLGLDE